MAMRQLLARLPIARRPVAAWVETGVLVVVVVALGRWLNPADPLFVHSAFPWPILVPLIAGLRYGFGPGFGAAAALVFATVAAWKGILPLHLPPGELSAERTVGLLLCGMITGEFSGLWRRRVEASETLHAHERLRLESFVRSYQALRLSHDLLESRVAGGPPTLRDALRTLEAAPLGRPSEPPELAQAILDLFSTFAQVRRGAVFLAPQPGESVAEQPAALLGAAPVLADPAVQAALRDRAVVTFESALAAGRAPDGAVVLAAPLEDVEGRLWGVLAVTDLPLSRYGGDAPARFAALAGHVADRLAFYAPERPRDDREEQAQSFAQSVRRAVLNQRRHGLASGLVQFAVEGKRSAELADAIARQRRVTDRVLRVAPDDGRATVTLLLPMTDDIGRARYLGRVEGMVRDLTGTSMAEAGVRVVEHAAVNDLDRFRELDLRAQAAAGARS